MGFFDALFGRTRITPGKTDQLFQLTTAYVDIQTRLDSTFTETAALVIRTIEANQFDALQKDIQNILAIGGKDLAVDASFQDDRYGFRWVVLTSTDLDTVITGLHMVADLLKEAGFSDTLLAAMFPFRGQGSLAAGTWYLIYSYRRGAFYPFVPTPGNNRDTAKEFRLHAALASLLSIEKDPERWYALWDPPI